MSDGRRLFAGLPGSAPLLALSEAGDERGVVALLQKGADPNLTSEEGWSAMVLASKEGHLTTVKALLDAGASPSPVADHTALRGAAIFGHVAVVEALLRAKADPNCRSKGSKTALMGAAMNGHVGVAKLLLASKADPDVVNEFGERAATLAQARGHLGVVEVILAQQPRRPLPSLCCRVQAKKLVRLCLCCSPTQRRYRTLARAAERNGILHGEALSLSELPHAMDSVLQAGGQTEIWLQGNSLTALGAGCAGWSAAELIYLNDNELDCLPEDAAKWKALQELNLSANVRLAAVPVVCAVAWPDLRQIYLNQLPLLEHLPTVSEWRRLKVLHANDTALTELPPAVAELVELRHVSINGARLRSLPAGVGAWVKCEKIFLNDNLLETLPAEIGRCAALQKLYLNGNRLRSLPSTLGGLESLDELYVAKNCIRELPGALGGGGLAKLYVDGNRELTCLPASLADRCPRLEILHASDCALRELPVAVEAARFGRLKFVHIARNGIEGGDAVAWLRGLDTLKGLRVLEVDGNPIFREEDAKAELERVKGGLVKAWAF